MTELEATILAEKMEELVYNALDVHKPFKVREYESKRIKQEIVSALTASEVK